MLKPATRAIAPSTISTNSTEVIQNVPINLIKGPSEAIPYLPTVKAMAPKAPRGANFMRMFTTPNTATESASKKSIRGLERDPTAESAKPNRIEISRTSRISPFAKASTTVVGMMCIRNSVTLCALACPA